MIDKVLNVVFTASGAGILRAALRMADRREEVIELVDNLSFGPFDSSDMQRRLSWVQSELGDTKFQDVMPHTQIFWESVLSYQGRIVLWTSRRSAAEYAGFLECLVRLGDRLVDVADLTDVCTTWIKPNGDISNPEPIMSISMLDYDAVVDKGMLNIAVPLSAAQRAVYVAVWQRMHDENAAFRIVGPNGISSAPINHFDNYLLSCLKGEWKKSTRVIGEALVQESPDHYMQAGEMVYFSRLKKLVENGIAEGRGDMSDMWKSEVRLCQGSAPVLA